MSAPRRLAPPPAHPRPTPGPPPPRPASPLMRRARPMGARGGAGRGGGLGAQRARASVGPRRLRQERVPAPPRAPLGSGLLREESKARLGSASRGPRGPGAWLREAPPAAPPAWGNFTPSRVSVPARAPAPWPRPPSPPRLLTLCFSFLSGSRRRRRRARCACSRRVQAQGEPGR